MIIRNLMIAAVLILASVSLPLAVTQQSTYEKALVLEETQLKLKEAIALYQKAVDGSKDKALAAQAQLHIGLCYEKLGAAEAEKAFRKVIEKYADQAAAVQTARERLSALTGSASSALAKPGELVLRQVSAPEGQPSPDGKFIAYVDYESKDNAADLMLYEIAAGNKKPLTNLGLGKSQTSYSMAIDPVTWAGDGSQIAFTGYDSDSSNKTELWKLCTIDRDGSNLKVIPINSDLWVGMVAGWTTDKKALIAVIRNKDKVDSIQRISLPDGNSKEIKTNGKVSGRAYLSPDAKYIAYNATSSLTGVSPNRDIRLLTADGSQDVVIVEHPANDSLMGWAADSSHIIFSSNRNASPAIWLQAIKDGKKDGEPKYIKSVSDSVTGLGITRNGSLYFVESKLAGNDVYIAQLDLKTGKTLKAPENVEPAFEGHSSTPFWSGNGDYLGYLVRNANNAPTIYNILRLYSTKDRTKRDIALNFSARDLTQPPRWSADGRYIFLAGFIGSPAQYGLYQIEVSTGQAKLICEGDVLAWAGDGTIAYLAKYENPNSQSERLASFCRETRSALWARPGGAER